MNQLKLSRMVFVGVCLLSCLAPPSHSDEAKENKPDGISQIIVQRTECFGPCPIDSLTLNSDGSAAYSGVRHSSRSDSFRSGSFSGTIGKAIFASLVAFLQNQNYFELKPQIGSGNIDASDFLVNVTRNRLPYCVVFRAGGNEQLQGKFEKTLLAPIEQIAWQRDDKASDSGIKGTVQRPLTPREVISFRNQPAFKSFPMAFDSVEVESLDHPGARRTTRSDGEGRFQLFLAPGRYSVSFSHYNFSREFRLDEPRYGAPSQTVQVKAKQFTEMVINTKDATPPAP